MLLAIPQTITTDNTYIQINLFWTIVSGAITGGGIVALIFFLMKEYFRMWIKDTFQTKRLDKEEKRTLADDITRFCSEGQAVGWSKPPRELEHAIFIIDRVDRMGVNSLATLLSMYLGYWLTLVNLQRGKARKTEELRSRISGHALELKSHIVKEAGKLKG